MENKLYIVSVTHHVEYDYGESNHTNTNNVYVTFNGEKAKTVAKKIERELLGKDTSNNCDYSEYFCVDVEALELDMLSELVYHYTQFYQYNKDVYSDIAWSQINRDNFDNGDDYLDAIGELRNELKELLKKDTMKVVQEFCEKNNIKLEGNKID